MRFSATINFTTMTMRTKNQLQKVTTLFRMHQSPFGSFCRNCKSTKAVNSDSTTFSSMKRKHQALSKRQYRDRKIISPLSYTILLLSIILMILPTFDKSHIEMFRVKSMAFAYTQTTMTQRLQHGSQKYSCQRLAIMHLPCHDRSRSLSSSSLSASTSQTNTKEDDENINMIQQPLDETNRFEMSVLYESNRVLAIHKPSGIPHHDDPENNEKGILTLCREYQQLHQHAKKNVNEHDDTDTVCYDLNHIYQGRLYGVHRLDRVTSGILLLAKDAEMASYLSQKFRQSKSTKTTDKSPTSTGVIKYYFGVSSKKPKKKKQGWIRGTMVRGRRKSWYLTTSSKGNSKSKQNQTVAKRSKQKGTQTTDKESLNKSSSSAVSAGNGGFAETRFFTAGLGQLVPFSSFKNEIGNEDVSSSPKTCILFRPYTGKTHQLRVAAKSIGLPLMGDPIYKDGSSSSSSQVNVENDDHDTNDYQRTYLHASAIHIHDDNAEEESFTIWSPPPFDESLWPTTESSTEGKDGFQKTIIELMRKNCDCPEILQLAEEWYTLQNEDSGNERGAS